MQSPPDEGARPQPVIRTYRGHDRRGAEEAYRLDAAQAAAAGWLPVAHRWEQEGGFEALSVIFELRGAVPQGAPTATPTAAPGGATHAAPPQPSPAPPAAPPAAPAPAPATVSAARAHARVTMQTLELHCAGEPLRLIRSGFAAVPFAPILERRRWVRDAADHLRRIAMHEPRGHRDMYGAVLLPPHRPDADVAVLFMHNAGWSTMCGHGIIALTTGLIEEGLFPASEPTTTIRYEAPAGLVTARASVRPGAHGGPEVTRVEFSNVPAFVASDGIVVRPEGLSLAPSRGGDGLAVTLAFGGAYYGIVSAADLGLRVVPEHAGELARAGRIITELLRDEHTPVHPTDADLGFVYGTVIADFEPSTSPDGRARGADVRNVTIFADGEVDRSPCGTGTSALLAFMHARGQVGVGQQVTNAGITGEAFEARIDGPASTGSQPGLATTVAGRASVIGYGTFVIDDRDPLGDGFLLG